MTPDPQGKIQDKHVECKIMTGGMDMMAGQVGLVKSGVLTLLV